VLLLQKRVEFSVGVMFIMFADVVCANYFFFVCF